MRCICFLSAVLCFAYSQKILTFHGNASVARYVDWLSDSAGKIRFQFRTRREGTLFIVTSQDTRWEVRLEEYFVVREYQLINQSDLVLTAEKRANPVQLFVDKWILFSVKVANQIISFHVSDSLPLAFPLKQHSNRFNWSLGSENSSFIGCIRNVKSTNQISVYPSALTAVSIEENCVTKCNSHSCVHGRCLEFYDSVECDCSGTKFSGYRCQRGQF